MASEKMSYVKLAILMMVGTLLCNTKEVSGQCGGNLSNLIVQCQQYVQKTGPYVPPSAACCTELRSFNVPCACKLVTKEIASLVSIPKAVRVGRTCGLKLPAGMQCGAIKIPPAAMK